MCLDGVTHRRQVARSVEFVQSGTTALQEAKTLQKKTRKWMCCAIMLLLVTAAVIVIVVSRPALVLLPLDMDVCTCSMGGGGAVLLQPCVH